MAEYLTTAEIAAYLRIKERTVYELVRLRRIPCSRATGRLLFPKSLIDAWVRAQIDYDGPVVEPAPPVIAGSHDPLLEWAVLESGCELALLSDGSSEGLRRLERGQALAAGLHLIDPATGAYNAPAVAASARFADLVLIHWAWREQGLVVAQGNPKGIVGIADLARPEIVVAGRQEGAGSLLLLRHLLDRSGIAQNSLRLLHPVMRTESDVAAAVLDGRADCGLAVASVALRHRLDFVGLRRERFDLAMRRTDYFEAPLQRLLWFTRGSAFRERAQTFGGYDVIETGRVLDLGEARPGLSKSDQSA